MHTEENPLWNSYFYHKNPLRQDWSLDKCILKCVLPCKYLQSGFSLVWSWICLTRNDAGGRKYPEWSKNLAKLIEIFTAESNFERSISQSYCHLLFPSKPNTIVYHGEFVFIDLSKQRLAFQLVLGSNWFATRKHILRSCWIWKLFIAVIQYGPATYNFKKKSNT